MPDEKLLIERNKLEKLPGRRGADEFYDGLGRRLRVRNDDLVKADGQLRRLRKIPKDIWRGFG